MNFYTAKPFVKWAGGKSQLLTEIRTRYPTAVTKYCEPFVGGGAVLFDVLQTFRPRQVLINDINKELINTYIQIKINPELLIKNLADLQNKYMHMTEMQKETMFYENRSLFNHYIVAGHENNKLEKAALFIFLNKTCFNGLYRVNTRGLFNVPWNRATTATICDEENIKACSEALRNVQIQSGDYSLCQDFIDNNTFVYIDPPYRPLSATASFTSYDKTVFTDKEQIELVKFIIEATSKKARILASNSDPKNSNPQDGFFDDLYSSFEVERVYASRIINSNAKKRGMISELLISNIASFF